MQLELAYYEYEESLLDRSESKFRNTVVLSSCGSSSRRPCSIEEAQVLYIASRTLKLWHHSRVHTCSRTVQCYCCNQLKCSVRHLSWRDPYEYEYGRSVTQYMCEEVEAKRSLESTPYQDIYAAHVCSDMAGSSYSTVDW